MNDTHAATEIVLGRRALLAGALAAGATSCAGVLPVAAQADTPVMQLFREWEAAFAASRAYEGDDEDEVDRLSDVYIAIEDRMMDVEAQSARDVFAKVWAYTSGGVSSLPDRLSPLGATFWAEAEKTLIG